MTGFRLGVLAVVAVVFIAGFLGTRMLDRSLKRGLEEALSQTFGCRARAGSLNLHWTSRTLVVDRLSLSCPMTEKVEGPEGMSKRAPSSAEPLVFVRRLEARFDLLSLLNRVMALESLRVEGGRITAVSSGNRDNYRVFLSRWISGAHPALSGAATIRTISLRESDLSLRDAAQGRSVTLHAVSGSLKPNLFMNRFRLNIPQGSLSGEIGGRVLTSSSLRATASFAQGGLPDLDILTHFDTGFVELQGQILSFDTEPVVSLFVHGELPLSLAHQVLSSKKRSGVPTDGSLEFRSYFHGRMNHLKARAVVSSPFLQVGTVHVTDVRMILSLRPGVLLARPVRLTINGTKVTGQIRAELEERPPVAYIELNEKGNGGLMGSYGLQATGTLPLPSRPEDWGDFLTRLERLARVS